MGDERRFGWLGAIGFFLAGCVVAFLALRYWPKAVPYVAPVQNGYRRSEVEFKLPSSIVINDPDKTEILSFDMHKSAGLFEPYPVTIKNLTNSVCPVTYQIFAYDGQHRRVDSLTDSVTLSPRETVLRKLEFDHPISVDSKNFASFRLVADIKR